MVDHLTQVTVVAEGDRGASLGEALGALGFSLRSERGRPVAESTSVEGGEAKTMLRALGYADQEYRIRVEFIRKWGFL